MAPARSRKEGTSETSNDAIPSFPAPPTARAEVIDGMSTTGGNVARNPIGITQAQKQALIDNFQLELTERARKLRAQYALQAQGLRTRLEMRVNRIPKSLRKRTMQDLLDEHVAKSNPAPPPPMPVVSLAQPPRTLEPIATQPKQTIKRKSNAVEDDEDKENMPAPSSQDLPNPKKRVKVGPPPAEAKGPTRTASRKGGPTAVLSPKSHNSRTLPQSPVKTAAASPVKTQLSRTGTTTKAAAAKPNPRAPSRQTKPAPPAEQENRTSDASNTSAGTTVVKRTVTKITAAAKKTAATKTAAVKAKAGIVKKPAVPATTGRTLRKRT